MNLEHLEKRGLTKEWLIEQRARGLPLTTIARLLDLSIQETCDIYQQLDCTTNKCYSNLQLLSCLEQAHDDLGFINQKAYDYWAKKYNYPDSSIFKSRFLDFNEALRILGLKPQFNEWSEEFLKYKLQLLVEEENELPTEELIDERCSFSGGYLKNKYGSLDKAFDSLGIKKVPKATKSGLTQSKSDNLFVVLRQLYPACSLIGNKSWSWLANEDRHLFIDFYIPEMCLAIECEKKPCSETDEVLVSYERDKSLKKQLCEANGLRFVLIPDKLVLTSHSLFNLLHIVYIRQNSHIEEFGVPYNRKRGDIGYDLHASHDMEIMPNQHVNVGTEVYLDMPYDIYASILLRSSMAQKGLMTHQSLIDSGFRGELKVMVWNFSDKVVRIDKGERVAQMLFANKAFISLVPTKNLVKSERNISGFGSTGF